MQSELKLLKVSIQNVLDTVEGLTEAQLNHIPDGFANNIIWNVAHLVVTQKLLVYGLSGNDLGLEADFVANYRKGTKPTFHVNMKSCQEIFDLFDVHYKQLIVDIEGGKFLTYKDYPTSYNFTITDAQDAICFNNLHYGLHVSTLLKMKKQVLATID